LDGSKTEGRFHFVLTDEERESADVVSIKYTNGVPVTVDAPVVGFELVLHKGYATITPTFESKDDLSEYYESVEHATAFHHYTILNIEGREEEVEGRYSFLLPDAEQTAILEELKTVLAKAKDAGLRLILDTDYGTLHAYNYKKAHMDYDGSECGFNFGGSIKLPEEIKLPCIVSDYSSGGDYASIVPNTEN
jgi:hypothetical protein